MIQDFDWWKERNKNRKGAFAFAIEVKDDFSAVPFSEVKAFFENSFDCRLLP